MKLNDSQCQIVASWIGEGLKISEIQKRISHELNISLTYMEVRLLVDDLKVVPKDSESAAPLEPASVPEVPEPGGGPAEAPLVPTPEKSGVHVAFDQIARLGALVSGRVTFSDGQQAEWSLDQTGRLSLAAAQKGYRPSPEDIQGFQLELQKQLSKQGF